MTEGDCFVCFEPLPGLPGAGLVVVALETEEDGLLGGNDDVGGAVEGAAGEKIKSRVDCGILLCNGSEGLILSLSR